MAANPTPITKKQKLTAVFPTRSPYIPIALFIILALLLVLLANPLRALYHQQQAGRFLAEVVPVGANDYGGFACLRPFLTDFAQRETLQTALYYLRKAENYAPKQAHTFYLLGKTLCLLGDYENAIQALQTFSDLRPKNPLGYLEMGYALLQACPPNGKCENGLNTYDAWRKAGVRAEDFLALAEKARQKEDYETALLWYQNAQRMGMELRSTIAYLRYLYLKKNGNDQEAAKALKSAVDIDRGWIDDGLRFVAWNFYGRALFYQHDFVKAKKVFKFTIALYAGQESLKGVFSDLYRYLAVTSLYLNEKDDAIKYITESVRTNPNSVWAHLQYGWILYKLDPTNKPITLQEFEKGLELAGKDRFIWQSIVELSKNIGQDEWVAMYCRRAQENGINELENCQ